MATVEKVKTKIGLESSWFVPIISEPENARPVYGEFHDMGAAVRANIAVNYAEGQLFGDDALQLDSKLFSGGTLDAETLKDDMETDIIVFGSKKDDDGTYIDHKDDSAPPGGYAFIQKLMTKSKAIVYRGVFILRVTGNMANDNAETKGSGITFANKVINYTISAANTGEWRLRKELPTKAEAETWLRTMAGQSAA